MTHTVLRINRKNRTEAPAENGAGLLMTATLTPPASAVARADPTVRLNDYLDALRFYLSLPNSVIDRILFVDNSDSDLRPLAELVDSIDHTKDVELISFAGNDHPPQRGKAYGEFKLMDFGLAHGSLFSPNDILWKTTGRLKFTNIAEMTQSCRERPFDFLCDLRNVPWVGSGRWQGRHNMELRVFAFRMRAYDQLLRGQWKYRETDFDAEFLYHRLRQTHRELRIVRRFPLQPKLQGVGGRHQREYSSRTNRAKDLIRGALRRVTPWLWI